MTVPTQNSTKPNLWKFLFLYGAIGWGVPTAILNVALISLFFKGASFSGTFALVSFVTFPVCGIVFGYVLWRFAGKNRP